MLSGMLIFFAGLLIALGALWSMQGAGWVHIKPMLCVADCAEVSGASLQWLMTGLATIAAGVAVGYLARWRKQNANTSSKPRV